jgi:hypothetical protein
VDHRKLIGRRSEVRGARKRVHEDRSLPAPARELNYPVGATRIRP